MTDKSKAGSAWILLLDYGPLLIFFATYKLMGSGLQGTLAATLAFMVAAVISIVVGLMVVGRVSPMVWLSTGLIVGFGAITLYLRDPKFIQMKPTIIYLLFAGNAGCGTAQAQANAEVAVWPGIPWPQRGRLAEAQPQLGPVLPGSGGRQ